VLLSRHVDRTRHATYPGAGTVMEALTISVRIGSVPRRTRGNSDEWVGVHAVDGVGVGCCAVDRQVIAVGSLRCGR